jgi:hypothetical protein
MPELAWGEWAGVRLVRAIPGPGAAEDAVVLRTVTYEEHHLATSLIAGHPGPPSPWG